MSLLFVYMYIAIVGMVFGSFFNVVGLRIPNNQSIVKPRSACPNCKHQLAALELIPIFSYLFQKGKCKSCGLKISPIYMFIELLTAILFTISPIVVGWSKELIVAWVLISLLMIILVSDIAYMIIPNKVLLFFFIIFIPIRIFVPFDIWWEPLLGFVVGFGMLFIIAVISKGGMGFGDVKLFALLGFVLGWKLVLLAFFLSTFFGALIGLIGMLFKKVKRGQPFPFGPFIVMGTLVAYFVGERLIAWYMETMMF